MSLSNKSSTEQLRQSAMGIYEPEREDETGLLHLIISGNNQDVGIGSYSEVSDGFGAGEFHELPPLPDGITSYRVVSDDIRDAFGDTGLTQLFVLYRSEIGESSFDIVNMNGTTPVVLTPTLGTCFRFRAAFAIACGSNNANWGRILIYFGDAMSEDQTRIYEQIAPTINTSSSAKNHCPIGRTWVPISMDVHVFSAASNDILVQLQIKSTKSSFWTVLNTLEFHSDSSDTIMLNLRGQRYNGFSVTFSGPSGLDIRVVAQTESGGGSRASVTAIIAGYTILDT